MSEPLVTPGCACSRPDQVVIPPIAVVVVVVSEVEAHDLTGVQRSRVKDLHGNEHLYHPPVFHLCDGGGDDVGRRAVIGDSAVGNKGELVVVCMPMGLLVVQCVQRHFQGIVIPHLVAVGHYVSVQNVSPDVEPGFIPGRVQIHVGIGVGRRCGFTPCGGCCAVEGGLRGYPLL